jgi:release factor glutamine methyltransferase
MADRPSIGNELEWAVELLAKAGILNAKREATAVWAALVGATLGDVWLNREAEAPELHSISFRDAIERRAAGEPLPYAVGVAGFRKLDLLVDRRVLIPRPETERLVEHVLTWAKTRLSGNGGGVVADIGTGSACIALSLATEGKFARVIATDVSPGAIQVAAVNTARVAPKVPVDVREGSWLEPLGKEQVDAIVSNPPYVTAAEFETLDHSVRSFEPKLALVGGVDGLEPTRVLLSQAARYLTSGGLLALELDSRRAHATQDVARSAGWSNARLEADVFGQARYLIATKESV